MTEQERKKREWFDQLYAGQFLPLYNHACWKLKVCGIYGGMQDELARDAVQMTFAAVWKKADTLMGDESPNAWIYRVLKNKLTDLIRAEIRMNKVRSVLAQETPVSMTDDLTETELRMLLEQHLSEEERQLLQRIYVDRDRPSDICEELGLKRSALSMRLRRIKEKLKFFEK